MGENIRLSFRGILSHKLRSFLTMLGIIIGIASIIAIVSTIQGTNEQIKKNLIGSGVNTVDVQVSQGDWEYEFYDGNPQGVPQVSQDTLEQLKAIPHAESVSLYYKNQDYDGITHLTDSLSGGYLYGIREDYFSTAGLVISQGKGISSNDIKKFRKVCVLDAGAEESLFPSGGALGSTVEIHGEPYQVVGIVRDKISFEPTINSIDDYYMYRQDSAGRVYIPMTTWPLIYRYDQPENVLIRADSTEAMTEIGTTASGILNANVTSEDISYQAKDIFQQAKEIQELTQSTNTMLIWIAAISLLVGGIGVMNIMLVSVTERTAEIGLKKAIGAPKRTIMNQFLTEAVVLTATGGVLGVATGLALAELISRLTGAPVAINWGAVLLAVGFSMVIGIVFGILPSKKAADLDPIEALRRE
ncbi:MAG: ABC transporter permease [Firmicutes bacterium]|nr:ABC transporter permease [Bacillota bacterium]MBQ1630133.1 ABC transporter permease [Bacillota bacterium]MBQ1716203.1 ABC transporter permease [Bacillota bacterium]